MANFDVDAHVEESVETWKYLEPEFARRAPVPITFEDQPALIGQNSFWLIDGAVVPRTSGKGLSLFGTPTTSQHAREKPFSIGSQELTDVERDDRVISTVSASKRRLSIPPCSTRRLRRTSEFEYALCRSYNSWIAEACAHSRGTTALERHAPIDAHRKAVESCAGLRPRRGRGGDSRDGRRSLLDSREFDPFWAEAERLNIPVYVHIGFESPTFTGLFQNLFMSIAFSNRASLLMGFLAIVGTGVAERFPHLRFVFAEAGVEWLPWLVHVMDSYWRMGRAFSRTIRTSAIRKSSPARFLLTAAFIWCAKWTTICAARLIFSAKTVYYSDRICHTPKATRIPFMKFAQRTDISDEVKQQDSRSQRSRAFLALVHMELDGKIVSCHRRGPRHRQSPRAWLCEKPALTLSLFPVPLTKSRLPPMKYRGPALKRW